MKFVAVFSALALFSTLFSSSAASAEEYVYKSQCLTSQAEDIARTIQGSIYLALRADKTVSTSTIKVKVKKLPQAKVWIKESELLDGLGFSFNPTNLSLSLGGVAEGHGCLLPHTVTISINVTRKSGTVDKADISTVINVPGLYATGAKVKASQLP